MQKVNPIIKIFIIYIFLFAQFFFNEFLLPQSKKSNAQEETFQYEITVTIKLVQVYITDKKGKAVTDLVKSDFEIFDNGKPVKITEFEKYILTLPKQKTKEIKLPPAPEVHPPMNRKFFLFFDFAFNDAQGILKAKKAALHFIDTQLHPTDEVGVISYSARKGLILHEYLTIDHKKVLDVVEEIGIRERLGRAEDIKEKYWERLEEEELAKFLKREREFKKTIYSGQVLNFSKQIKKLAEAFRYIPGTKHIILFSGGVSNSILFGKSPSSSVLDISPVRSGDSSLRILYEKMIRELAASNTHVYAINTEGFKSLHFGDRDMMGDHSLKQLAILSGGKYFGNIDSYEKIVDEIQNITSTYYVLGYYINEKWDGKYHNVKVKVKRKGCRVYGQGGYFNPKPFTQYSETEKLLHLVDLALSDKPHFQEPLHFPLITLPYLTKEKSDVLLLTKIPGEKIKEILGRKAEIVSLIFDDQKNITEFNRDEISAYKFFQTNVYYYATSSLSPGQYDCRVVIRDLKTGKGAVAASSIVVPDASESGLLLYPPLFLIPEKNALYLKETLKEKDEKKEEPSNLFDIYPFDPKEYSPLVGELKQGISRLLVSVRYSCTGIKLPEVSLSAFLIQPSSGERHPLSFLTLSTKKDEETTSLLIEIKVPELKAGKYLLNLVAEEQKTKSKSHTDLEIQVR